MTPAELRAAGHLDTAGWFTKVERVWEQFKTQRNRSVSFLDWLNWQNKLTDQDLGKGYLVLYSASAKDANASVYQRRSLDKPFVVDYAAYWFGTDSIDEANYLAAFLNADEPNRIIKDFQARGLFGARHISKTILEVPLPRFDPTDADHAALAALGAAAAASGRAWVGGLTAAERGGRVGTLRRALRGHLAPELSRIDAVLRRLV